MAEILLSSICFARSYILGSILAFEEVDSTALLCVGNESMLASEAEEASSPGATGRTNNTSAMAATAVTARLRRRLTLILMVFSSLGVDGLSICDMAVAKLGVEWLLETGWSGIVTAVDAVWRRGVLSESKGISKAPNP